MSLEEANARLQFMTSENITNPFANDLLKGKIMDLDEEDDDFGANEEKKASDFLNMYP